jgi:phage terminase large subunit
MVAADDRRIPGWRILREYLHAAGEHPILRISSCCEELIRCIPALLCDALRGEDASGEPHDVTHAPEALRYGVMSRHGTYREADVPDRNFTFSHRKGLWDEF